MDDVEACVSIDGPGTVRREDALWVRAEAPGWTVDVYVVDAAAAVPLGSEADATAFERATTRFYHGIRDMVPAGDLPPGVWLDQGERRAAVRTRVRLDGDLRIASCESARVRCVNAEALTFEGVSARAGRGDGIGEMLSNAASLAAALKEQRRSRGALAFEDFHPNRVQSQGEMIATEASVLAGRALGERFAREGAPATFRHAPGKLSPTFFSTEPRPHAVVGAEAYASCASPMRSYGDLDNQRRSLGEASRPAEAVVARLTEEAHRHRVTAAEKAALDRALYDERLLGALDDVGFGRATAELLESGRRPQFFFAAEFTRRMAAGRLRAKDYSRIVFGRGASGYFDGLAAGAAAHVISQRSDLAEAVALDARSRFGARIAKVVEVEQRDGRFFARDQTGREGPPGATKQGAVRLAYADALAYQTGYLGRLAENPAYVVPASPRHALHEKAALAGMGAPTYVTDQTSRPPSPMFRSVVAVGEARFAGTGPSKPRAENAAAEVALREVFGRTFGRDAGPAPVPEASRQGGSKRTVREATVTRFLPFARAALGPQVTLDAIMEAMRRAYEQAVAEGPSPSPERGRAAVESAMREIAGARTDVEEVVPRLADEMQRTIREVAREAAARPAARAASSVSSRPFAAAHAR